MFRFESVYFDDPPVPGRAVDFFRPDPPASAPALFFVHGGGWRAGSRDNMHALMRAFSRRGHICASTDYRLAATAVEQLSDVRLGYALFVEELRKSGAGDAPRVAAYGTSAGAHLAALLALAKPGACREPAAGADTPPPAALVLSCGPYHFAPWPEIFPPAAAAMRAAAGAAPEEDPDLYRRLSPIEHVGPASCPTLCLCAANEHMFPTGHAEDFAAKMREYGRDARVRVYANAEHGFFYDTVRVCQQQAFDDIRAFLAEIEAAA